jgi:uncharacterized DUF497 family protein
LEQKACPGPFGDHLEKEAEKAENIAKHGISFIKAAETFTDPLGYSVGRHQTLDDRRSLLLGRQR